VRSTPTGVAAAQATARLLESLGHTVEETFPAASKTPRSSGTSPRSGPRRSSKPAVLGTEGRPRDHAADVEPLSGLGGEGTFRSPRPGLRRRAARRARARASVETWHASATTCCSLRRSASSVALGTFSTPDEPLLGFIPTSCRTRRSPTSRGQPAISLPLSWNSDNLPIASSS